MGLNIVAERKMSLKEFAEGWDDCYLMIRVANETKRQEWRAALVVAQVDEEAVAKVIREACLEVITSGVVMSTGDNGVATPVTFEKSDVPELVEALNFAWQQEVVGVSTGNNRLKAQI
jgi:hypothetical protein